MGKLACFSLRNLKMLLYSEGCRVRAWACAHGCFSFSFFIFCVCLNGMRVNKEMRDDQRFGRSGSPPFVCFPFICLCGDVVILTETTGGAELATEKKIKIKPAKSAFFSLVEVLTAILESL